MSGGGPQNHITHSMDTVRGSEGLLVLIFDYKWISEIALISTVSPSDGILELMVGEVIGWQ